MGGWVVGWFGGGEATGEKEVTARKSVKRSGRGEIEKRRLIGSAERSVLRTAGFMS